MFKRITLAVTAAVVAVSSLTSAQVPVPSSPPGHTYGNGSSDAKVQLETFIDVLCPYSKTVYPVLKQVADHYGGEKFLLKFVQFPLPYHLHAYSATQAGNTVAVALGEKQVFPWFDALFANQDLFRNKVNKDIGSATITDKLKQLAQKTFPSLTDADWDAGMTGFGGTPIDSLTRVEWKYACTRGIAGTPSFILNGVPYAGSDEWGFEEWKKALDPIVNDEGEEAFVNIPEKDL